MKTLNITVANRVATYRQRDGDIVCGNTDYQILFVFDDEWDSHPEKTARFISNGKYTDVPFTGNVCPVPVMKDTTSVTVGLYAGELCTTTPVTITCVPSILCGSASPSEVESMRKGTTPSFSFTLPFDTSVVEKAKVIFKQDNRIVLEKYNEQCTLDGNTIHVKLTQEETYLFESDKYAKMQLRVLTTGGDALASEIFEVFVEEFLDDEVLI